MGGDDICVLHNVPYWPIPRYLVGVSNVASELFLPLSNWMEGVNCGSTKFNGKMAINLYGCLSCLVIGLSTFWICDKPFSR